MNATETFALTHMDPLAATVAESCYAALAERQPDLLALVRMMVVEAHLNPDQVRVRILKAGSDAFLANICEMAAEYIGEQLRRSAQECLLCQYVA